MMRSVTAILRAAYVATVGSAIFGGDVRAAKRTRVATAAASLQDYSKNNSIRLDDRDNDNVLRRIQDRQPILERLCLINKITKSIVVSSSMVYFLFLFPRWCGKRKSGTSEVAPRCRPHRATRVLNRYNPNFSLDKSLLQSTQNRLDKR
jgi:hypothetical protein